MSSNSQTSIACEIRDLALADSGKRRIEWAFQSMPVLQTIRKQLIKSQPLAGIRIAACLHVTAETANLMITLRDGGAAPVLCAASPLSTQDDVAAALVRDYGISVYALRDDSDEMFATRIISALDQQPQVVLDDAGDLMLALHRNRTEVAAQVIGGVAESTTTEWRLQALARDGALAFPAIAVCEAQTRRLFDSRYGTAQSTIDGIVRVTNVLLAGMTVVVAGYGWCGRGFAVRARGMGANVIVTETDPIKAIEAVLDGCRVMSMTDAAAQGDLIVTFAGNKGVVAKEHFEKLKSGAILCNAGHSNVEIDLETLGKLASNRRQVRESVEEFAMRDGRRIYVLGEGRLINLAAPEGHPASVLDMGFSTHALAVEYLVKNSGSLEPRVYAVPEELDRRVARMKLDSMGVKIDRLTPEQERYLAAWSEGN